MNHPLCLLTTAVTLAVVFPSSAHSDDEKLRAAIERLIDRLAEVADADYGYSPSISGSAGFSPLQEGHFSGGLLFQRAPVSSGTLRELVKHGVAAVPLLMDHLDDKRPTRLHMGHDGFFGGLNFEDDCDYNARTEKKPEMGKKDAPDGKRRTRHTVTVGDLCYVALGQIVNRHNIAVRYQPTAIIIVNSPTHSPHLAAALKKQWAGLTAEKHRSSLLADFEKPDHVGRRIGAAVRLAYYYPGTLEGPALKFLAEPAYEYGAILDFVYKKLYAANEPGGRLRLFNEFIEKHGKVARQGILQVLFKDLETLEGHEQKSIFPPDPNYGKQSRELLIQLFDKPRGVKSTDRPLYPDDHSLYHKATVLSNGLIYDNSTTLDRVFRDLLVSDRVEGQACIARLIGRGFDREIEKYCRDHLPHLSAGRDREELQSWLDKLGWTRLHVTVERHHYDQLRAMLRGKVEVNALDRAGRSALHVAAKSGDRESVRLLLEAKANPNSGTDRTAAAEACEAGHLDVVQMLVEKGAAIPDVFVAATVGAVRRLDELLKKDPALVWRRNTLKKTPLHLAAERGHAQSIELLLSHKIDIEVEDNQNGTALHLAAYHGHEDAVRVLLRHMADPNRLHRDSGLLPLHLASMSGNTKVVELLLDAKVDVNSVEKENGRISLHHAALGGHEKVVALLLKRGARISAFDKQGYTALHVAAKEGRLEMARVLLRNKAAVAAHNDQEWLTPLLLAVRHGHASIVKLLLDQKAPTVTEEVLSRLLRVGKFMEDKDVVKVLKEHGAKE